MKIKSLKRIWHSITYMQVSLLLFAVSCLISLILFIQAIRSGGNLSAAGGALGILALCLSIAGFAVPLYGRFIVHAEVRTDYRIGLLLNGVLMLILFFFYFLGL